MFTHCDGPPQGGPSNLRAHTLVEAIPKKHQARTRTTTLFPSESRHLWNLLSPPDQTNAVMYIRLQIQRESYINTARQLCKEGFLIAIYSTRSKEERYTTRKNKL